MYLIPFFLVTLFSSLVIGIQSSETTTNDTIQLNNENTTSVPETILLNSTKITATADDTVQNDNKSSPMITKDVTSKNIDRSSTDIPTKIDNVSISDKLVGDVVHVNEIHMRDPIEWQSFEINANDSQLGHPVDFSRFLLDNPDAIVITSIDYPNPYPDKYNQTWSVSVNKGIGIEVIVHHLDINPLTDFLYIRGGLANSTTEKGATITGHHKTQLRYKLMHTQNLFIWCDANQANFDQNYTGFQLTYAPFGEIRTTTPEPEELVTVPPSEIQTIDVLLEVSKVMQKPETWQSFKNILSNATNTYIQKYNISVESAKPENVTILFIQNCPVHWPSSEKCIRLRFGIPLWPIVAYTDDEEPNPQQPDNYELNSERLLQMWSEFGRNAFERTGTPEYILPDSGNMIVIWSGISLAIVATFLLVLYMIWKMDLFQEYKRMHNGSDDRQNILKNQSDIDISMFPSPHQIVPTLFPTNDTYMSKSMAGGTQQYDPESSHSNSRKVSFSAHKLVDLSSKKAADDEEVAFSKMATSPSTPRSRAKVFIRGSSKNSSTS